MENSTKILRSKDFQKDSYHVTVSLLESEGIEHVESYMSIGNVKSVKWRCPTEKTYDDTVRYWKKEGFQPVPPGRPICD